MDAIVSPLVQLRRLHRDAAGVVSMTYVVLAVLIVAAVAAAVLAFSGVLGGGMGTAGHAAGGQTAVAARNANVARENFEVDMKRAISAQESVSGGEFLFAGGDADADSTQNAETGNAPDNPESSIHHPVFVAIGHFGLDLLSFVDMFGIGTAADVVNAGWYAKDGNTLDASLTMASAVPVVGWAGTATKWGKNVLHGLKLVRETKFGRILVAETADGAKVLMSIDKIPMGGYIGKGGSQLGQVVKTGEKNETMIGDILSGVKKQQDVASEMARESVASEVGIWKRIKEWFSEVIMKGKE